MTTRRTSRYRPLAGVLAAVAVAQTGTAISAIAIPWLVLVTTGSAAWTGVVAACELAPYVAVKAFAGPVLDRTGPRLVSWSADLVSAAAVGLIPGLHALHLMPFWLLPPMVALVGTVRGPGDQAKELMIVEAAQRSRVPLERATGLVSVTDRLATTLGPAFGGALVAVFDPFTGLLADAGCFVLGSVVVTLVLPRDMGRAAVADGDPSGYWRRFHEGLSFLRGSPLMLTVIVVVGTTNLLDQAFSAVLLPVWAQRSGAGAAVLGIAGTVRGIAAVAGSLVAAATAHRMRRRLVFLVGFLIAGAPRFWVLAAHAPLWMILVVFAVGSVAAGFLNPILGAIQFELVPQRLLGRVLALTESFAWAGIPLGGLVAGAAVTAVGLAPALVIAGAAYLVVTSVSGLRPEWREMDRLRGQRPGYAADQPGSRPDKPSSRSNDDAVSGTATRGANGLPSP